MGRSRLLEGTSIYSWQSTIVKMGLKRKALPTRMPECLQISEISLRQMGDPRESKIARIVKTLSFVIHQEFHILSFIWESDILILSTNDYEILPLMHAVDLMELVKDLCVVMISHLEKGTDISQKDGKPIKKRQNRTRDGKVCGDKAKSKVWHTMDVLSNNNLKLEVRQFAVFEVKSSDVESTIANNWTNCDFYKKSELGLRCGQYGRVARRAGLVNTDRSNVSTARSISAVRPVSTARPKDLKPNVKTFGVNNMTTVGTRAVVSKGKVENVLKKAKWGNPEILLQDHAVVDSGCSSHMTGNKAYLSDYEDFNGGFVAFGSDPKGGKITGKGKIKTANLDFDDVYFVDELKQVVLRAPRKDDVYSLDLKNIVPSGDYQSSLLELLHMDLFGTCLYRKHQQEKARKQLNHNVKIIRYDNGTEFKKNYVMNELCAKKGIKREFSVARTPQQNGVVERKNRTLIEATRTTFIRKSIKEPTHGYILLLLQPHRTRILVKDVVQDAQEQPSENASPDKDIQDSEDVFDKEGQHQKPKDEQVWQDKLEMMATQELVANAMNDESRQAFEEEKRRIAAQKKAAQATSTNQLSTDRSFVSTDRSNTPNVSAASTSTGANADKSSFVYLGGKIPIDASTLSNADLPIDPNMPDKYIFF
ncbi:putative ribonuclease H-like domain-containing protein [Tanacetum coccineum]